MGFLAGAIAKFLFPGKQAGGLILTTLLGIVGAAVGGWLGTQLGFGSVSQFNLAGLGISILGAMVVLLVFRAIRRG